jgi:hypothetical protein
MAAVDKITRTSYGAGDAVQCFDQGAEGKLELTLNGFHTTFSYRTRITAAQAIPLKLIDQLAGGSLVITAIDLKPANANADVDIQIGLGLSGITTVIYSNPSLGAGRPDGRGNGGGIIAMGADNEDLYLTCTDPTGYGGAAGAIDVLCTYGKRTL